MALQRAPIIGVIDSLIMSDAPDIELG